MPLPVHGGDDFDVVGVSGPDADVLSPNYNGVSLLNAAGNNLSFYLTEKNSSQLLSAALICPFWCGKVGLRTFTQKEFLLMPPLPQILTGLVGLALSP